MEETLVKSWARAAPVSEGKIVSRPGARQERQDSSG